MLDDNINKGREHDSMITYNDMLRLFEGFKAGFKVQTGILDSTREQISSIERTLRGHNGDIGLVAKVDSLAEKLEALVEKHLPKMIADLTASRRSDFERFAANNELELLRMTQESIKQRSELKEDIAEQTTELKIELDKLRREYDDHKKIENEQSTSFGGWKWFRDKFFETPLLLIITVILTIITSSIVSVIAEKIFK